MPVNEAYSRVWVGEHLSDMFPLLRMVIKKSMLYRHCFSALL